MEIRRNKHYKKDALKVKLTDEQYTKRIKYLFFIFHGRDLPSEARDHSLMGEYKGSREFHLGGDVLLIYRVADEMLYLQRLGTHSQLFK